MPGPVSPIRSQLALLGFLAASLGAGALGRPIAVAGIKSWYGALHQPPLSPPGWVFAPVWITLYVLIAVAAWLAWRTKPSTCRDAGLRMWAVQLVNNFAWIGVFFGLHAPWVAAFDLLMLIVAIVLTIRPFRTIRPLAAWLLAPYLAWCCFALYLNVGIALLNHPIARK